LGNGGLENDRRPGEAEQHDRKRGQTEPDQDRAVAPAGLAPHAAVRKEGECDAERHNDDREPRAARDSPDECALFEDQPGVLEQELKDRRQLVCPRGSGRAGF
jgi:hypothetical protein